MLTIIVTITGSFICSANSYYDNNEGVLYAVKTVIATITRDVYVVLTVTVRITRRSIYSVNTYCEKKGEVYMQ